jgi:hypothetical protein
VVEGNTAVITVTTTDVDSADAANSASIGITGGADSGEFEVSGSALSFKSSKVPDFESPSDTDTDNEYIVEITATDGNSNVTTQTVTVTVTDSLGQSDTCSDTLTVYAAPLAEAGAEKEIRRANSCAGGSAAVLLPLSLLGMRRRR